VELLAVGTEIGGGFGRGGASLHPEIDRRFRRNGGGIGVGEEAQAPENTSIVSSFGLALLLGKGRGGDIQVLRLDKRRRSIRSFAFRQGHSICRRIPDVLVLSSSNRPFLRPLELVPGLLPGRLRLVAGEGRVTSLVPESTFFPSNGATPSVMISVQSVYFGILRLVCFLLGDRQPFGVSRGGACKESGSLGGRRSRSRHADDSAFLTVAVSSASDTNKVRHPKGIGWHLKCVCSAFSVRVLASLTIEHWTPWTCELRYDYSVSKRVWVPSIFMVCL